LEIIYQIDTSYACAGIIVDKQGIVIKTAPIFSWMEGKHIQEIRRWKSIKKLKRIGEISK